jgi:hypothetical protein
VKPGKYENCRFLHCAPPDFLWSSVALIKCVRLSLRKGAFVAIFGATWQEIQVRSGRVDKVRVGALTKQPAVT